MSGRDHPVPGFSWGGRADDRRRLVRVIDAWVDHPELTRLVAAFGGPTVPLSLLEVERFAAANWDFRGGLERNLARPATFTAEQDAAVGRTAAALGMRPGFPVERHYDTIIMTGGMVRADLVKPRFVASLFARGIGADNVVFLGAHRGFVGDEIELAAALGVEGSDEVAAMGVGVERAFAGLRPTARAGEGIPGTPGAWSSTRWQLGRTAIEVLAAPSSEPHRRADTADTYRFWLEAAAPLPHHRVLIVTTPVYVPYQAAAAVEMLGLGAGLAVETVGVDAAAQDLGPHTQVFTPANHLQELRAAIGAVRSLRAAATVAGHG